LILSRESSRLAQALLGAVLRGLERFTGLQLLRDVAEFVGGIEQLSDGFQSRAAEVQRFLRRADAAFVLVTTPEAARVAETLTFQRELARADLPFRGFIVNRVLPEAIVAPGSLPDPEREHGADLPLARKLAAAHRRFALAREHERAEIARLEHAAGATPLIEIALQVEEPSSLDGLAAIAVALAG
jgi:anion-transporting  ArsA/GET3 family ATPase